MRPASFVSDVRRGALEDQGEKFWREMKGKKEETWSKV